ncbi:MAG: hypothetical protein ACOYMG_20880, partial [Candidatus Methylumidiphilus sp.]
MLLNEVQRLSKAWQAEKDQNLAQEAALKAEQAKVSALESRMLTQTQTITEMKQQMALVQAQAKRMETLAARLVKLDTQPTVGTLAVASKPWPASGAIGVSRYCAFRPWAMDNIP